MAAPSTSIYTSTGAPLPEKPGPGSFPSASTNPPVTAEHASASPPKDRYKLIFYVPESSLEVCKTAVFEAGGGRFPGPGSYTETCFVSKGIGQFKPGESANPNIGEPGKLEHVEEARCEILCVGRDVIKAAVEGLKKAHPYEEPAYEVYKMEEF